ncbi:MAG: hypothetical protein IJI19_07605 [Ruminococcus sp.]|nr:hypothetical protein [Ruminococcus sp.]
MMSPLLGYLLFLSTVILVVSLYRYFSALKVISIVLCVLFGVILLVSWIGEISSFLLFLVLFAVCYAALFGIVVLVRFLIKKFVFGRNSNDTYAFDYMAAPAGRFRVSPKAMTFVFPILEALCLAPTLYSWHSELSKLKDQAVSGLGMGNNPFGGDVLDNILEQTFGKALFFFKLPIILALAALILQFVFLRLGKPVWFSIFSGLLALVFVFTVSFFASAVGRGMEWLAAALPYVFATVMAGTFITYGFYNE